MFSGMIFMLFPTINAETSTDITAYFKQKLDYVSSFSKNTNYSSTINFNPSQYSETVSALVVFWAESNSQSTIRLYVNKTSCTPSSMSVA